MYSDSDTHINKQNFISFVYIHAIGENRIWPIIAILPLHTPTGETLYVYQFSSSDVDVTGRLSVALTPSL